MEKFTDNKDAIKSLLKQGKFVVSGRGTGKTMALAEILYEDKKSVVVVHNQSSYLALIGHYTRNYKKPIVKGTRIFVGTPDTEQRMLGIVDHLKQNIYVDEYLINHYTGPFYAAVTSFPLPVVVL